MKQIISQETVFPAYSLFENFVNRFFNENATSRDHCSLASMAIDLRETEKSYELIANLPGIKKEDIKISVQKNQLVIEAKNADEPMEKESIVHRKERYNGCYQRSIYLPDNVETEQIQAKMENGVLTLILPKIKEKPQKYVTIE